MTNIGATFVSAQRMYHPAGKKTRGKRKMKQKAKSVSALSNEKRNGSGEMKNENGHSTEYGNGQDLTKPVKTSKTLSNQ